MIHFKTRRRRKRPTRLPILEILEGRQLLAADAFEPNDTLATAADLGSGTQELHDLTIHRASDEDYFRWTAGASGTMTAGIDFEHDDGDLNLFVLDAEGSVIGSSESTMDNESVAVSVVANETYVVRVIDAEGLEHAGYDLSIGLNTAPTISVVPNQTLDENATTGPIPFTVGDAETSAENLIVTAVSSNTALVPDANIVLAGTGANRTVTVTPAQGQFGLATITLSVNDGLDSSIETFVLTVSPKHDLPTISDIPNITIDEDTTATLEFFVAVAETPVGDLIVTASSSNPDLVPDKNILLGGSGINRTITVSPLADRSGMTTVTVTVSNGRDSVTNSFRVTVRPVNDPLTVVSTSRGGGDGRFDRLASLAYTFSGDVSESLGPDDLMLVDAATGTVADLSPARVSWDAATRTAVWDLSQVAMVEGKYVATLKTSGLRDAEGNQLDGDGDGIPGGDYTQTITRTILGDADLDLTVGFADFVKLANHFGEEGTWLEGDFTGDNLISFDDFMALADNFGRSVPNAADPTAVVVLASGEDFSRRRSR